MDLKHQVLCEGKDNKSSNEQESDDAFAEFPKVFDYSHIDEDAAFHRFQI